GGGLRRGDQARSAGAPGAGRSHRTRSAADHPPAGTGRRHRGDAGNGPRASGARVAAGGPVGRGAPGSARRSRGAPSEGPRPDAPRGFRLMGIVNVTPDAFSDGGRYARADAAIGRGAELIAQGAEIVDVGGESTRPGAGPVPADEELGRVIPVVQGLAAAGGQAQISIDTSKSPVAAAAIAAGASFVNDVSALRGDPEMAGLL